MFTGHGCGHVNHPIDQFHSFEIGHPFPALEELPDPDGLHEVTAYSIPEAGQEVGPAAILDEP
jgi:hypothetical protein